MLASGWVYRHNGVALGTFTGVGASPPKPPPLVELQRSPFGLRFFFVFLNCIARCCRRGQRLPCHCGLAHCWRKIDAAGIFGRLNRAREPHELIGQTRRLRVRADSSCATQGDGFGGPSIRIYLRVLPAAWSPATPARVDHGRNLPSQKKFAACFAVSGRLRSRPRLRAPDKAHDPGGATRTAMRNNRVVHENSRVPGKRNIAPFRRCNAARHRVFQC